MREKGILLAVGWVRRRLSDFSPIKRILPPVLAAAVILAGCSMGTGSCEAPVVCIYDGYVYYADNNEENRKLRRRALEGDTAADYVINQDLIYYGSDSDIVSHSLANGMEEVFAADCLTENSYFYVDDNDYYICECGGTEYTFMKYDRDGSMTSRSGDC